MTSLDLAEQQAAKKQLAKILAHRLFSNAPRLSTLLRYLVEEVLGGRGDQLKEYAVGVAALDRGSSFDPRLDSIVRVEASKLRRRLESYYKDSGAGDPILIELPRGSYAPCIVSRISNGNTPHPLGTVAVLPFVYLGPEPDEEYLSDGLTEDSLTGLGRSPNCA